MTRSSSALVARSPEHGPLPACLTGTESTQLLVELAHDLRSPLTAILTLAESLQSGRSGPLTDGQRHQLGLIYTAALSLCGTTSDTIELARGVQGKRGGLETFSLGDLLADVRATVMPMAEERGVTLEIDHSEVGRRRGDERALRRTLLNLATNALKATEVGGVRIVVRPLARGRMEFAVIDTGPGLRPEALQHLWEPFRPTLQSRRSNFSSAGLGLSICRKLVRQMGGLIRVESTLGRGSRFHFVIPLPSVGPRRVSSRAGDKTLRAYDTRPI